MRPEQIKYMNDLLNADDGAVFSESEFFFLCSLDEKKPIGPREHNRLVVLHERVFP